MAQTVSEDTSALLTRLSQKPGVQSTLIISRVNGAIVRASGLISQSADSDLSANDRSLNNTDGGQTEGNLRNAEDVARIVWSFFSAAGRVIEEMEDEDEVKLLRLRSKKHELVIVPDPRFLLVVIHDTPPA